MIEEFFVTHKELLGRLLDWPFLLFILLILGAVIFRKEFRALLGRGDITISWGEGRSIRLHDISEHLDKEMDQIRDELDIVKEAVHKFHSTSKDYVAEQHRSEDLSHTERGEALSRMKDSLKHGRWRWRTLERLAIISGITEKEALTILRGDPEVNLGQDKKSNYIAKIKHR